MIRMRRQFRRSVHSALSADRLISARAFINPQLHAASDWPHSHHERTYSSQPSPGKISRRSFRQLIDRSSCIGDVVRHTDPQATAPSTHGSLPLPQRFHNRQPGFRNMRDRNHILLLGMKGRANTLPLHRIRLNSIFRRP